MTNATNNNASHPQAIFMMGGPGSGKGYVCSKLYGDSGIQVLDCDSIKAEHPDYDPKDPAPLHEWSAMELKRRFKTTVANGEDFIYDGTGSNAEKYAAMIKECQEMGFETTLVYVQCSLPTALKRNASRTRVVPEWIVREKHSTIATSFEIVSRYADTVNTVDND